jgi:hypothetical protein
MEEEMEEERRKIEKKSKWVKGKEVDSLLGVDKREIEKEGK